MSQDRNRWLESYLSPHVISRIQASNSVPATRPHGHVTDPKLLELATSITRTYASLTWVFWELYLEWIARCLYFSRHVQIKRSEAISYNHG